MRTPFRDSDHPGGAFVSKTTDDPVRHILALSGGKDFSALAAEFYAPARNGVQVTLDVDPVSMT